MRVDSRWVPAQPGVMLYVPAPHVEVEDMRDSLSQLSVFEDISPGKVVRGKPVFL